MRKESGKTKSTDPKIIGKFSRREFSTDRRENDKGRKKS